MFQEPLIQFHLPGTVMNHPGTLLGHHRMTKNAGGYYKYFWTKMTQNGLTSLHNIHFRSLTFNSSSVSGKNTGFLSSLRAILFFWSCSFRLFNLESCWFRQQNPSIKQFFHPPRLFSRLDFSAFWGSQRAGLLRDTNLVARWFSVRRCCHQKREDSFRKSISWGHAYKHSLQCFMMLYGCKYMN